MAEAETPAARARALRQAGRLAEALDVADAAARRAPDDPNAQAVRGNVLMDLGRLEEALAACDLVVALAPGSAAAHANRANVLLKLGRPEAALGALDAVLRLSPQDVAAHHNRGAALLDLGRTEAALAAYAQAVALRPDDPQLRANEAAALLRAGRVSAAEARLDGLPPAAGETHWNLALRLLSLGRYRAGWRQYEHRWRADHFLRESKGQTTPELRARFDPALSVADLEGRRVLLVGEQGVGDVLMFASILPDLLRVAGAASLVCDPRLKRLFARSFPGLTVLDPREPLPEAEVVAPIGTLARLFRNRLEDFPGTPYLAAAPEVRRAWAGRLGPRTRRLRVGLAWRGGTAATRQALRSIPFETLAPLLARDDCEFVSLQYGDAGEAAGRLRVFPPAEIEDFEDLAGLVQSLDVVVSVQTAVVHLAGALGTRALVLLPHEPEWRYAAQPEAMPWYRSVRLFRQDRPGDWDGVIRRVGEALA